MSRIAFLGLGAMGSRMSAHLLQAGHRVTVWNRSPHAGKVLAACGAAVATTPLGAIENAEFVFTMVTDDDASRAIWLDADAGAVNGLAPDTLAIECSTVTPGWIHELSAAVGRRRARALDAPVVGSLPQASAKQLVFLVGAESNTDFEKAKPILSAMGSSVHNVGSVGAAASLKLAVNALFATQVAVVGEILSWFGRAGLDEKGAWDIVSALPVSSPAAAGAARLMLKGEFAPLFPIRLVEKDLRYAVECGAGSGGAMPIITAVQELYARAAALGLGDENIVAVSKIFR